MLLNAAAGDYGSISSSSSSAAHAHTPPTAPTAPSSTPAGATTLQTGLNMMNELEGAGLLGLPYAAKLCGWVSLGMMGVVGVVAGFTGYLLAMCMYEGRSGGRSQPAPRVSDGRRVRDSYAAVGEACFGAGGKLLVKTVQVSNLVAVGVVYLVLIGASLATLSPLPLPASIAAHLPQADHRLWTAIATAAALPTVHIGGYKKLAALSALGLLCLTAVIVVGVAAGAAQLAKNGTEPVPPATTLELQHLPAAISIYVFAFSAHGIFPDLEASMAKPRQFPAVVSVVFLANMALKLLFTLVCFLAYGQATQQVVSGNYPDAARKAVGGLIVANTLLSFPLPLVPVFRAFDCAMAQPAAAAAAAAPNAAKAAAAAAAAAQPHGTPPPAAGSPAGKALKRSLIVLFCGGCAFAIPSFAVAMGFMGSITLSFLTFIFPATFYLKLHGGGATVLMRAACVFVICFGVLGGVAGIASNIAIAGNFSL